MPSTASPSAVSRRYQSDARNVHDVDKLPSHARASINNTFSRGSRIALTPTRSDSVLFFIGEKPVATIAVLFMYFFLC